MAKQFVNGSVEWLIAMREGALSWMRPMPKVPPARMHKPAVIGSAAWLDPLREARAEKPVKQVPWVKRKRLRASKTPRLSDGRLMTKAFIGALGQPCCYCRRQMSLTDPGLIPTRDHVHPVSKGGGGKRPGSGNVVWACDDCNHIKGNMLFDAWKLYMASTPYWWTRRKGKRRRVSVSSEVTPQAPIPVHETVMILRHGKAFWRAWKHGDGQPCECCRPAPCGDVTYSVDGLPIVPFCGKRDAHAP